jgi:NADP-dependent 3-hydroxy acid dehydrogenase YdfG
MNKIVFITGATAGIGESCAVEFAKNGYSLIISGRRMGRLAKMKEILETEFKVKVLALAFDVRDREAVSRAIEDLPQEWTAIDILVNNAGLAAGLDPIHEGSLDDWETMIDTNVKGLLYVTRAIVPSMMERGKGHVINIGSIAGKEVYPKGNVYCSTKHAVDALSKGMRIDLVGTGIKVTQVAPGAVETEFSMVRFKGDENRAGKVYDGYEPLIAEDIARLVYHVTTLPARVNVNDLVVTPTDQANAYVVNRNE